MNASVDAVRLRSLYAELADVIDDRALDIVARRKALPAVRRRRGWLIRRALLVADVAGLFAAFLAAQWLFASVSTAGRVGPHAEWALFLVTLPGWIVVAKLYGLYDRDEERTDHSTVDDIVGVFHLVTVGAWLFFAGAWLTDAVEPDMPKIVVFWLLAVCLVCSSRAAARSICRRSVAYIQNAIVVGAGDVGQMVARKLLNHPEYGINLVGFVDGDPKDRADDLGHVAVLGAPDRLPELIRALDIERVVVAYTAEPPERTIELVRQLQTLGVQIDVVPRLYELVGPGVALHTVEGLALFGLPPVHLARSSALLKRTMDLLLAVPGLVVVAPVFALIAVAIVRDSPGPVFFRQTRMGANGVFRIWKFRTMSADAEERKRDVAHLNRHLRSGGDARMFKIEDDPRVTRVGRVLRRYSLDELPQLLNVVRGEMTLVGPRPLILEEDSHVAAWARPRLTLKPGITGPWQVLGRTDIPFDQMVNLDYHYVTSWSLLNDVRLILRTFPAICRPSRAY